MSTSLASGIVVAEVHAEFEQPVTTTSSSSRPPPPAAAAAAETAAAEGLTHMSDVCRLIYFEYKFFIFTTF